MDAPQMGNPLIQLFPIFVIFLIFYFMILRPQQDKQKQLKNMIANLKKNDQIVTSGGIHGTVINVKEHTIIMRIDDNVKVEIDKEAITTITKTAA